MGKQLHFRWLDSRLIVSMPQVRSLDVVLFGATGFVGKLTAAYLARAAPGEAYRHRRSLERNSNCCVSSLAARSRIGR